MCTQTILLRCEGKEFITEELSTRVQYTKIDMKNER